MNQSLKTSAQYAKANYYHSDGTGRDTYIAQDNGGLTGQVLRCTQPPVGAFRPKRVPTAYRPQSSHKTLHYISDGSGRDNYVLENHGGLMNTQSDAHWMTTFKSSLRTPDRIRPKSGAATPSHRTQQDFCRRLSRPRAVRQPFHIQVANFKLEI